MPENITGTWLREARERLGLTQKEMAEAFGVHANTIAKVERGEQEMSWPGAVMMAVWWLERSRPRRP